MDTHFNFDFIKLDRSAGAGLAFGSGRPEGLNKALFAKVTDDTAIAQEEAFRPLRCIIGFSSDDDAIRFGNDFQYGLIGAIQTVAAAKGYEMAPQIRTGSDPLNGGTGTISDASIGGCKRSGIAREYDPGWLREYQHEKSIFYPIGK